MKLNAIVELLRNLETDELNEVLSKLNETHEQIIDPIKSFKELILKRKATLLGDRPYCPHCESQRIVKNGLKDGRQSSNVKTVNILLHGLITLFCLE